MARFNSATLLGRVYNMAAKPVGKDKTDGVEGSFVLNFRLECYSEEDKRSYRIPVAVLVKSGRSSGADQREWKALWPAYRNATTMQN